MTTSTALDAFVQEQYARLCSEDPRASAFRCPVPRPKFEDDEARGFLRGFEAGLFSIEPTLTKPGHREMAYVSDMCNLKLHFFGIDKPDGHRSFSREAVTQWAAASDLVLGLGWLRENVQVESSDQWALDLVAYDRPRHETGRLALLAMEAKSHRPELDGLIDEMKRCRGLDPAEHRRWPKVKSPHRKCEGLLRLERDAQQVYFWAVSPGYRRGLVATFDSDTSFTLTEVGYPPIRPLLGLTVNDRRHPEATA